MTSFPSQAVVLAGGRGTRLGELTRARPKPLVPVAGRPFLDHLLGLLAHLGFERVDLLLGHRAEDIAAYVGDAARWGIRAVHHVTPPEVQTLTRLREALPSLDQVVMVAYCDNYVPLDGDRLRRQYAESGVAGQVVAYANDDLFTRSNLAVAPDGRVLSYDRTRNEAGLNRVDLGFALLDWDRVGPLPEADIPYEHIVHPALVARGELTAHVVGHRYYGVGAADRLPAAERFFGGPPTVLLDRDGVLNRRPPRGTYVHRPEQLHWLDGALDAVRRLTAAGCRLFVVTNQAGVARGVMSQADLDAVHRRLMADVAAAGGRIDGVYACVHGWEEGCGCRKPAPGMLWAAQREHDLDLSRSVFVGDDERDLEAAGLAGCTFRWVTAQRSLADLVDELLDLTREWQPCGRS